ncbi:uncharacterized protein LOC110710225 [Chenopodium quinoa]|uniref:uncharacterized protein LOC110710225 n=1 Tax=Chenopodium quinoa TaxID=63459 RepID=UPI000B78EE0B|nr:uncharacterized protein LOC110710225 [Chenopodium quinoa]
MAKKKTKNRDAGTWETKAVQNVNKDAVKNMLMEHIIPAIQEQWPASLPKNIKIQWDNARPHQIPKGQEFIDACHANGFNIEMVYQPAQSPDLNVLNLGLFEVIQSLQYQSFSNNLDDLNKEVTNAYNAFETKVNKYIWLTLQLIMIQILTKQGGNNFQPPHMKKKKLDRLGILPKHIHVSRELVHQVVTYLDTMFIPTTDATGEDAYMEVDAN